MLCAQTLALNCPKRTQASQGRAAKQPTHPSQEVDPARAQGSWAWRRAVVRACCLDLPLGTVYRRCCFLLP